MRNWDGSAEWHPAIFDSWIDPPQLCLARQLCLWENAHVDDIASPCPVHVAFSSSGEQGPLHTHHSLFRMQLRAMPGVIQNPLDQGSDELGELLRKWVTKRSVCNDASALKEGGDAGPFGPVYDLIGDDEVSGANLLAQRSHR